MNVHTIISEFEKMLKINKTVHFKALFLLSIVCFSLVSQTHSYVIAGSPPVINPLTEPQPANQDEPLAQQQHNGRHQSRSTFAKATRDGNLSDTALTVNETWYTSGTYANKELYFYTKQVLTSAALKLYTRLPSNKTGLNATYMMEQINPNGPLYGGNWCNTSNISDVCTDLLVGTIFVTGQNQTAPYLWVEFVTMLVFEGANYISHFYTYGCIGTFGVSRMGGNIVGIPDGTCPNVTSGDGVDAGMLASGTGSSTGSTWDEVENCFRVVYDESSTTYAWTNCLYANPAPYAGLAFAIAAVAVYKTRNGINQNNGNGNGEDFGGDDTNYQNFASRYRSTVDRPTDNNNQGTWDSNSQSDTKTDVNNDVVADASRSKQFAQNELNTDMDQFSTSSNQQATNQISYISNDGQQITVPPNMAGSRQSIDTDDVYDDFYNERIILDYCDEFGATKVSVPQLLKVSSCSEACENMSGDNIKSDAIQSETYASNDDVVQTFTSSNPGLGEVDTSSPLNTNDAASDILGSDFTEEAIGENWFDFASVPLNFFMLFSLVDTTVSAGMAQLDSYLEQGFAETMSALQQLSTQMQEEFHSTIDDIDQEINSMDANLDCYNAWVAFRSDLETIDNDYQAMIQNYQTCKVNTNYTGSNYFQCEFDNWQGAVGDTNWQSYTTVGNPSNTAWEDTEVGQYMYECARFKVISGATPQEVASYLTQTYSLASEAIRKAGNLYRYTAAVLTGYNKYTLNNTHIDYNQQMSDGYYMSINQTASFGQWFLYDLAPPAVTGYLNSSIYTDLGYAGAAYQYKHVQMLNSSTYESMGYLTPSLWLPVTSSYQAQGHVVQGKSIPHTPGTISEESSGDPPSLQFMTVTNITNLTYATYQVCSMQNCYHTECECQVTTTEPCTLEYVTMNGNTSANYTCQFEVLYSYQTTYPARGWVGLYSNDTSVDERYVAEGMPLCTPNDVNPGDNCISGVIMQMNDNNQVKLWANNTFSMQIPNNTQWEYQQLLAGDVTGGKPVEDVLFFQMFQDDWGWKFGDESYSEYLSDYYAGQTATLENIYNYNNASDLSSGDNWRYNWVITTAQDIFWPVKITFAETVYNSNSTFGFACPLYYEEPGDVEADDKGNACLLTQSSLPYETMG